MSSPGILSGTSTESSVLMRYALLGWISPVFPTIGWLLDFRKEMQQSNDQSCISAGSNALMAMWYDIPKCIMIGLELEVAILGRSIRLSKKRPVLI